MGKQKKLMLLGGLRYLLPAIEAAHRQGYYVLTADYLPDNYAHRFADEYVNVSIIDKEAVLKVAQDKQIDGILSFAVDPGVVTAAYVQEQMHLPAMGPYQSVCVLQNKARFRRFLLEHDFNVPWIRSYTNLQEALADCQMLSLPAIVKPTDSAGSKGVSMVTHRDAFEDALRHAFANSFTSEVIVEQYIEAVGHSSDSDCFSVDGQLKVVTFSSQLFDPHAANPFTPAAFTWPSTYTPEQEAYLTRELQRLITLLGMQTTLYNVETRIGTDGKAYLMEVSPRAGGNRLAEMVRYATGIDLITAAVRAAVGDAIAEEDLIMRDYSRHIAYLVLHAPHSGVFQGIDINPDFLKQHQVEDLDLWVKRGDRVDAFTGANTTIGTLPLQFRNKTELTTFLQERDRYIRVLTEL